MGDSGFMGVMIYGVFVGIEVLGDKRIEDF